ncbi:MAG: hypothetical protein QM605_01760 [Sphingobium sp.]
MAQDGGSISVTRASVEGTCPECAGTDIRTYPVLSEGGWMKVVKCQSCLASLSREPDPSNRTTLFSMSI